MLHSHQKCMNASINLYPLSRFSFFLSFFNCSYCDFNLHSLRTNAVELLFLCLLVHSNIFFVMCLLTSFVFFFFKLGCVFIIELKIFFIYSGYKSFVCVIYTHTHIFIYMWCIYIIYNTYMFLMCILIYIRNIFTSQ